MNTDHQPIFSGCHARTLILLLLATTAWLAVGCSDPRHILIGHEQSATTGGHPVGRDAAAKALVVDWQAGLITLDLALDHAHDLLESGHDRTSYAGAVLDLAASIEGQLPRDPAAGLLLYRRIGRLAYRSAELAMQNGRIAEAGALVLAGPRRWQNEAYWLRYPDHDALVALIWAGQGRRLDAIARLDSRPVLTGPAEQAYELLTQR